VLNGVGSVEHRGLGSGLLRQSICSTRFCMSFYELLRYVTSALARVLAPLWLGLLGLLDVDVMDTLQFVAAHQH